jgi:selenide,water dikinase
MGGEPILALNIACFPSCMDMSILGEIMRGGADKVVEAGCMIVGGHTVDDKVPKYGLSVMGRVHPDKVLPNSNAKPGDLLLLTKPLGTGVINTAIKGEAAEEVHITEAIKVMTTLNKYAAQIAKKYIINSCTDITGFGLLGHVLEMAEGSKVTVHINSSDIKFIDGAAEYAMMGLIPQGTYRNRKHCADKIKITIADNYVVDLLFDPQTSGGLVYSLPELDALNMFEELKINGIDASIIGYVSELEENYIIVE